MDLEEIRDYCLSKQCVDESSPFGEDSLVYKVLGKIFCISIIKLPLKINLKCDPARAIELRETYEQVIPGYHMNKKHWNTIILKGIVSDLIIKEWIDDSYRLVVKSLPKKEQQKFKL